MNTFCPDDLPECDSVPCAHCHGLFHPTMLNQDLHCAHCECAEPESPAQ